MMVEANRGILRLEMKNYLKNKIIFGINSAFVCRKNLIVRPSTIKKLSENQKKIL